MNGECRCGVLRRTFAGVVVLMVAAQLGVSFAAETVKLEFLPDSQQNYEAKTKIATGAEAGGNDFRVFSTVKLEGEKPQFVETAWAIHTKRFPLAMDTIGYAFEFEVKSPVDWNSTGGGGKWSSRIFFYGADGKELKVRPLLPAFKKGAFARLRFTGRIPTGAKEIAFALGKDDPNVLPTQEVFVRGATYTVYKTGEEIPAESLPDMCPPLVRSLFKAPTEDRGLRVKYEIVDESGVDWTTLVVSNVLTQSVIPFTREGNVVALQPGTPWPEGAQRLTVSVRDVAGNAALSQKAFLIGKAPQTPRFTLRDDGMTLIDGKPFFPIGIYGVCPCELNTWDLDRAVGDLKKAGFNFIHSYTHRRDPELLAAVRRHGLYGWTASYGVVKADEWFVDVGRHDAGILSWYNGDDTSMNTTPAELLDREEACRLLDGTRLTCQADGIGGDAVKSRYQDFVPYTDVILPEVYWIYTPNRADDWRSVAKVICDVDRCHADIAKYGKDKPHGVWPIVQAFHGRMWKRYPDEEELVASTFASIIHGANGITWFHYSGELAPERGRRYSGFFQTKRDWTAMTNLATRISSLAPVLVERTPPQPKTPEILRGEKLDHFGKPAVTVLVKKHAGSVYVFAVNAVDKSAKARIFADVPDGEGEALWENRRVKVTNGAIEDDFKGFGVHVYCFSDVRGAVRCSACGRCAW